MRADISPAWTRTPPAGSADESASAPAKGAAGGQQVRAGSL